MATVQSYGATQEVTGSCHILEIGTKRVMIDCGMFQGEEESLNERPFAFNPSEIESLFLTHAHLDHIGRVPQLVKEGFKGKIYTTAATKDLAYIILLDSVKIMNEEFNTHYKKALRRAQEKALSKPLYGPLDLQKTFTQIEWVVVEYEKSYDIFEGVSCKFFNAGHILGSAFIEFFYRDVEEMKSIIFSGDIGNSSELILPPLARGASTESLYIESTYGDRNHQPLEATVAEFKRVVVETLQRGGNLLIPSFAIERTQELLCILRDMYREGELPKCKLFLDSPMATKATDIYTNYVEELTQERQESVKESGSVFDFEPLLYTQSAEESKAINDIDSNAIIIAGSGMCNGGRITHHFKHRIWNEKNSVIFVGYQASGTLGREIVEGAKWINLYGEDIIVKASIHTINGFSAHADQEGMLKWIEEMKNLKNIYIVHGEVEAQTIFKERIKERTDIDAHIVKYAQKIELV